MVYHKSTGINRKIKRQKSQPDSVFLPPGKKSPGIAWEKRPGAKIMAIRLFFPGGSTVDGAYPGISHVLEHILAAGNGSPEALARWSQLSSKGAIIRGETAREYISIGIECLVDHWRDACRTLNILAREAGPLPGSLKHAADSVMAEICSQLHHQSFIWNKMAELLWGSHSFARSTTGDAAVVPHLTSTQIIAHHQIHTIQGKVWIGACGIPDLEQLKQEVDSLDWGLGTTQSPAVPELITSEKGRSLSIERGIPFSYVVVAWPGPGGFSIDSQALRLIETAFGHTNGILRRGMRDFGYNREIYTGIAMYRNTGYLAVWTKCFPGEEERTVSLIKKASSIKPDKKELEHACRAYETQTWLRLENSYKTAGAIAVHGMTGGPPLHVWINQVINISLPKILEIMTEYINPDRAFIIIVRPGKKIKGI